MSNNLREHNKYRKIGNLKAHDLIGGGNWNWSGGTPRWMYHPLVILLWFTGSHPGVACLTACAALHSIMPSTQDHNRWSNKKLRKKLNTITVDHWQSYQQHDNAGVPVFLKQHTGKKETRINANGNCPNVGCITNNSYIRDWGNASKFPNTDKVPSLHTIASNRYACL
jgi:hypothetical protein